MCDDTKFGKNANDELLKNLKINQLFSVDILVENVIILHGPYKNAGDLDHITDSSEEEPEPEETELTVGMALCDPCCSPYVCVKQKKPRIKKTCHTIVIDSWAPGVISSKIYNPPDACECQMRQGPPELCQTCIDRSVRRPRDDRCKCEREYCFSFPIDSWGPKISSRSGIDKKSCNACRKMKRSQGSRGKSSGKGGSTKDLSKGKKGKGSEGKGSGKDKDKKKKKIQEPELVTDENPEEPPKPKKKKYFCPRPPMPVGPLPPIRLSVSLLHIKDVKMNQVDIDKLYPPEDEDPSLDQEEDENDNNGDPLQPDVLPNKTQPTSRVSASSKNIITTTQNDMASTTAETGYDSESPTLTKYRELGASGNVKCSKDLGSKQKTRRKQLREERDKRMEVIRSLRGVTDFKRGFSFIFAETPLNVISKLMAEKLVIVVERSNNKEPTYPIGKAKITLPTICRERVQAAARITIQKALWTCFEDTYPVIDCKGKEVGTITIYFCLTSLGSAMVSPSLISDSNLYEYTDSAKYIGQGETGLPPEPRATAFTTSYNNLQQVTHREYNKPHKAIL